MTTRKIVSVLGLLFVACSFGSYETIVPTGKLNVPRDALLGVSVDASTLWAVDLYNTTGLYQPRLKVFDTDSGDVVASNWWGGTWGVRALAPAREAGYENVAWVLHENGYRIRWNATLVGYSELEAPIPLTGATAADGRLYCDLDTANDGAHFLTTIDTEDGAVTSYLYRSLGGGVQRVALPTLDGKCAPVSWDSASDDVFLLDDNADEMLRFDADDLTAKGATDMSDVAGSMTDFSVIGAHAVVASAIPGPAADLLVIVDPDGAVLDSTSLARVNATQLSIVDDTARAYWTGMDSSPVKYTAGYWTLED